jgi:imidazolonepropionase-like amidohydrolase
MVWSGSDQIELYSGTKWTRFDSGSGALLAEGRIQVSQPRAVPDGSILFAGGMAFTMANGDTIIDQADVLVTGNRIAAIGPSGTIRVPDGTVRRDVSGKIIMPGFIDVHDHIGSVRRDVPAYEDWGLRARLAYGVTTSFDPSTLSPDLLEYEGLVDIGKVLGPRLRSTGVAIMSKERFSSLEDVREVLDRYSSGYGIHNLKQYRAGDREVRQWIAKVSNEQELLPTTEGALSLKLDLTQILDGYAGNEHALPAWPLGDDVIALMVAMRTSYVTTLSTTNGGSPALNWFVPRDEFALDDRVRRFWSPAAIRQKMETVRPWRPLHTFRFPDDAGGAARLASAGGLVGMGGHGEAPGIGFHWELEAHAIGGMSPMAVLHAATAGSAETVGRLDDLGTLEAGKLADLVVLDANPLQDIRNTRHVVEVMRGGFLYEAATLAPVWPHPAPGPHAWFEGADVEQWLPVSTADLHDAHDH